MPQFQTWQVVNISKVQNFKNTNFLPFAKYATQLFWSVSDAITAKIIFAHYSVILDSTSPKNYTQTKFVQALKIL